jgi:archaellum component FlaC
MKASLFLKQVLNKVGDKIENRSEIDNELEKINFDLPDSFDRVIENFSSLMSETAAQSKPAVANAIISKYNDTITKAHLSKMQGMGFTESEIAEVVQVPVEERLEKIASINTRKLKAEYSLSETERISSYEAKARAEKERADRIQAQLIEKEDLARKQVEQLKEEYELRNLVGSVELNNNLPIMEAHDLLMRKVQNRLAAVGAKIVSVRGTQKIVQSADEALDYYDERNNRINPVQFVEGVAQELNLLKPKVIANPQGVNQRQRVVYDSNSTSGQTNRASMLVKSIAADIINARN